MATSVVYRRRISWKGALAIAALLVVIIYFYWRSSILNPKFDASLAGVYAIVGQTGLQIPDVFRGRTLTIRDLGGGKAKATNDQGKKLEFSQRTDGLFFKETFSPVGPIIPLGIAKNWNEGLLKKSADGIVVEGSMREKGLSVFGPFEDVTPWRVQLIRIADLPAD